MPPVEQLLEQATRDTGLDDFGPATFREGLEVLLDAVDSEAGLHESGQARLADMIGQRLRNRLHLYDWHRREPDIARQPVPEPVFVIGLWRTGTTIMSYLMAQDTERRSLRRWEAAEPAPPPGLDADADRARVDRVAATIEDQLRRTPDLAAVNIQEADGPTECSLIISPEFKSQLFDTSLHVPSFYRWNRSVDQRSGYDLHRATLQLLQWRCPPRRWHLKSPSHTLSLDALQAVYPDARFIVVHRDPVVSLASACDFWSLQMRGFTDRVDGAAVGRHWLGVYTDALDDLGRFLATGRPERVVQLQYRELSDPVAALGRAYDHLGLPMTATTEQRMARFLADHRPGRHGAHRYALADFGLSEAEVRERFRPYVEAMAIE